MRERRRKKSGSGATVKGKWSYYGVMNFLEYCLQRRTMEMFQRQQLKFHSLIQIKLIMGNSEQLEGENIIHAQKMEGGPSKKEQSAGIKKRKITKISCCWYRQTI